MATEERGVKRLKNAPRNFSELLGVVVDQTKNAETESVKITYVDDAGDEIAVSDDEDLAAAYDWASTQSNRNIKLSVKDRVKRRRSDEKEEVQQVTEKFEKLKVSQPQESSDSSDEEDTKKGGIMHKAIGIPSDHKDKKEKKALRKFIKKSMKEHSKELIQSIMDKAGDDEPLIEEKKASEQPQDAVHVGVECDGCGVAPITGVRYKCSVTKDFDYCSKCEASKPHKHAFIKIVDMCSDVHMR